MSPADLPIATRIGRLFSFPVFLGALLVAGVFLNLSLRLAESTAPPDGHWHATFVEGDTFWHMAAGQRILKSHHWPTTNDYSSTAPHAEWLAYEWLGEVAMALTWNAGGPRALMVLLTVLLSAMVLLVYYAAVLASGNPQCAFVATALMLPLLGTCFSVRPQLLGHIFLLITLIFLERYRQGLQSNLWVLPAVCVLWVNTHGTYVFGLLALGIYGVAGLKAFSHFNGRAWLSRERQHLAIVSVLCLAALLVNPYGPHLLRYELGITRQPVNLAHFQEWQPIPLREFFGCWFIVLCLALAVGSAIWRCTLKMDTLTLTILAVYLACRHQRFVVIFAIVAAPALARILAHVLPANEPNKNHEIFNAAFAVITLVAIVAAFPSNARLQRAIDRTQPTQAMDFLRAHPIEGPMFNDDYWGGYLIWSSHGEQKVFIDGRSDAYETSGVLADYIRIFNLAPDAATLLERYGVRACLAERSGALSAWLGTQPHWERVYEDGLAAIFVLHPRTGETVPSTFGDPIDYPVEHRSLVRCEIVWDAFRNHRRDLRD